MANTLDLLRRRVELAQAVVDNYEGFDFGIVVSTAGVIKSGIFVMTPYIAVPSNCAKIRVKTGYTQAGALYIILYSSSKTVKDHFSPNANPKEISFTAGQIGYVRCTMLLSELDNCYVYDVTNGSYLWKGDNV